MVRDQCEPVLVIQTSNWLALICDLSHLLPKILKAVCSACNVTLAHNRSKHALCFVSTTYNCRFLDNDNDTEF